MRSLDRVFVQVGGGAFAACLGAGLADTTATTRLHAVQTEGCAPLAGPGTAPGSIRRSVLIRWNSVADWSDLMTVWDHPRSIADGILDDETYDWLGVFAAMSHTGGSPVVASEADMVRANDLARAAGYDVSATGSAGLAGLLAQRDRLDASERVAVVMSGVGR